MEKKNVFLGKIKSDKCYVNDGKYGYFLTCDKKNYKIPEWFPHEKMDLETAEKFIIYKDKMSQLYSSNSEIAKAEKVEEDDESSEEEPTLSLAKNKKK
jgi:topoisomerase IA-like protein